jgi:hypothetical protein
VIRIDHSLEVGIGWPGWDGLVLRVGPIFGLHMNLNEERHWVTKTCSQNAFVVHARLSFITTSNVHLRHTSVINAVIWTSYLSRTEKLLNSRDS